VSISACHREHKPIVLRVISISVIAMFLVTQMDIQLAFGFSAPPIPIEVPTSEDLNLPENLEDIYYQEGFLTPEESPLTPVDEALPEGEEPAPDQFITEAIPESFFEVSPK